ncbi:hypothetical protein LWI29_013684 [Acer saccharum]|uniref:Uncharacterized protein n=1 Tax=Acer saccharum TaxID=4024 RepID=A0AA39RCG7_ACESA|nr:hypothetical protein LWI29_013684 [Acer saccharum]
MMFDALEGWKSCAIKGSAGSILATKTKAMKLRLKNWSSQVKSGAFSLKDLEVRLGNIDKRAATNGWSEVLRAERTIVLVDIWRRNQKLLEEAPSHALTPELRKAMVMQLLQQQQHPYVTLVSGRLSFFWMKEVPSTSWK